MKFPSLPWTDAAADWLSGKPSTLLTIALLVIAALCVGLALWGGPVAKALAIAWFLLP